MGWVKIGTTGKRTLKLHDGVRSTHMHVLGISGQGKSYFLESLIRQDILDGHGVCVIDPHGELYENMVQWIAAYGLHETRNVHLLNPSDQTYTFGWNPLAVDTGVDLSVRVASMVDACVKVWGGKDVKDTPRLAKCLQAVFFTLARHRLSLVEAHLLTGAHKHRERKLLTRKLDNVQFEELWREFDGEGFSPQKYMEYFESTTSRLLSFVGNPVIREIVGQTENLINFRECMDQGHIVLVNLGRGARLSKGDSQLLGALITNDLYTTAFGRDVGYAKTHPFYAYIDECAEYVTDDIAHSLDETRKFGLHWILSHQRLQQLQEYGDNLYNAVMANAQTKVVFKVNDEDTAETMAKHLFRKEFDLERPKHILDKPVVVGYRPIWLESESEGVSHITGSGVNYAAGAATSAGVAQAFDAYGQPRGGYTTNAIDTSSSTTGHNSFEADAHTQTAGRHQALEPQLEVQATATYNLEELIHEGMVKLLALPKQQAFLYNPTQRPVRFSTTFIRPGLALKAEVVRAAERINETSVFVSRRDLVRARMDARADQLVRRPAELITIAADDSDDDDMLS